MATGVGVVRKALSEPARWIALNAGQEGSVVVAKIAELPAGHGYNAATGEYGDLIAQGVIDPVKVTRSAVQNAASIAGMLLTTETLIVEKPEEEKAGRATATATPRPLALAASPHYPRGLPALPATAGPRGPWPRVGRWADRSPLPEDRPGRPC